MLGNVPIERVSCHPEYNEQLLYFTTSSLSDDEERLVFLSDRTGDLNIFQRDLKTNEEVQLSDNREGVLTPSRCSELRPLRGINLGSVAHHTRTGTVYYVQGSALYTATAGVAPRKLADLQRNEVFGCTHLSDDGKYFCVCSTDSMAWDDGDSFLGNAVSIDARVRAEKLNSYLNVYDTQTGELVLREAVPCAWVTHVQFRPGNPKVILYNHEQAADCGIRRLWLWDGKEHIRLRTEGPGRSRHDWVCHEMWERDGNAIIYHGGTADNGRKIAYLGGVEIAFVGRLDLRTHEYVEIPFPKGWKDYGHFVSGETGLLASDAYYLDPTTPTGDTSTPYGWSGKWISLLDIDWKTRHIRWIPLTLHGTSWKSQDEHPHPIFDRSCRHVYFNSDREGKRAIYRVKVDLNAPSVTT
jgi:oligogalacturonide lyase